MSKSTGPKLNKTIWAEMKIEFITTDIILDDLAIKYNINASLVRKNAGQEAWMEQRKLYKEKFVEKALEKSLEEDLEKWKKRNHKSQELAELIMGKIEHDIKNNKINKQNIMEYKLLLEAIGKGQDIERKCFGVDKTEKQEAQEVNIIVKLPNQEGED